MTIPPAYDVRTEKSSSSITVYLPTDTWLIFKDKMPFRGDLNRLLGHCIIRLIPFISKLQKNDPRNERLILTHLDRISI